MWNALKWVAKLLWRIVDDITRFLVVLWMATLNALLYGLLFGILYPPLGVFVGIVVFMFGCKSYDKYRDILEPKRWEE